MVSRTDVKISARAALPVMLGYVAIGIPCGILCASIGLNGIQVLALSYLFYSGAGQFMLPNMYLAACPLSSIIASISFVNMRQLLYAASFAPYTTRAGKLLLFFFGASVTDESFGVSIARFREGNWTCERAFLVNLFSQSAWAWSNFVGVCVGGIINVPLAIASFAMTSIFICLMITQKLTLENVVAMIFAVVGVYICKLVGLTGPAILIGACIGVLSAEITFRIRKHAKGRAVTCLENPANSANKQSNQQSNQQVNKCHMVVPSNTDVYSGAHGLSGEK